ncbi:MAG: response regulator [Rhodoferax sp.]|uniref:hybrid sensor histidine kinase/response regulator n=1 Tax=Rhodoferax sp. TaxID=50421 RepID=UPI002619D7A6|nr:response regulator [Rhodoferax sp.]MDD2879940.1 response regulator [Rhodoferax sp.]
MTVQAALPHSTKSTRFFKWLPRRLEWQLMLLISVCLVLSIMGYGAYRANAEVKEARHNVSEHMVSLAKNLATISAHFLQTNEPESVEPLLQQLSTVDGIYSVLVTDLDGRPITEVVNQNKFWSPRYGAARANVPDTSQPDSVLTTQAHNAAQRDFLAGTGGILTAWQRIGGGMPMGWIRINYRLDAFDAITANIYKQTARAVAIATLVTLLLLALLLRPSMRALREATEFASQMDTRMGRQLQVSHLSTEIEALGSALNLMSERLMLQHAELHSQKFALDQHAIVSITDLQGNITYANQRFCDISGFTEAELIGQNHRIIKSGEHSAALFEDLWHTITQGKVWHGDVKNRKKDGTFYWVSATIVPLLGQNGLPHHYIGIRTDITANKLLEENLQLAKEDAEAATQVKAQFLANMSHEIRTPMNAILGMLKLLQNTELNKRQLDYANKAEGAAESLLGLINDILDFSKIDAGKMTLEVRAFRLDKLLRDLSVIVSANLGAKPVEVLFDIDPATPKALLGDALRLQQVLINLASNAIKFTPKGEVVISIKPLAHTDSEATLQFAVRDSGIGIAPENQQHIFTGFSQAETSTTRRFGGTGLGLSISRKLVALMGGELRLQSVLGQGSTFSFTVTLPLAPQASPPTTPQEPVAKELRVLVVDDNPTAREVLGAMAESLGWQVETAADGAAALALVQQRASAGQAPFQAMFIDWHMPDLDGWQTLEQLQAAAPQTRPQAQPPLMIMVTAHGRETLSQRSAEDQARLHGFLVKPVTASMMFDAVVDALASRSQPAPAPVQQDRPQPLLGLHLLVVEDNFINQQVAQEMLSQQGAHVALADNGQLGVEAVRQAMAAGKPFDAVLMDIQMPVMDGYTATRMLRENLGLRQLPIIAMTANAMASDRDACLAAGMNEHVGKPFNLTQLVSLLQKLCPNRTTALTQTATDTQDVAASAATATATQAKPAAASPDTLKASGTPSGTVEPPLPPTDAVDVTAALERLGNNRPLYARVLQSYLSDIATQPDKLARLLQDADLTGATRLLHTVKGLSATVGASYMAAVARKAELAVKVAQADASVGITALDQASLCEEFRGAVVNTQTVLGQVALACTTPATPPASSSAQGQLSTADLRLLNLLQPLLKASDMQALAVFEELQRSEAVTRRPDFEPLAAAMAGFDFAAAAKLCAAMTQKDAS